MSHPTTFTSTSKSTRTDIPMRSVYECVDGRYPSGRESFPQECGKYLDRVHITLIMRFVLSGTKLGKLMDESKKTKVFVIAAVISD